MLEWSDSPRGVWGNLAAQWIIERSQCLYRCVDLKHVPRGQRARALALKLGSLSPYRHSGHYAVWRGGSVLLWMWDGERQQALAHSSVTVPRRYRCIPEPLLLPPPTDQAGFVGRILATRCGFDLQVWSSGCLLFSSFHRTLPSKQDINFALRSISGSEWTAYPEVETIESSTRPWAYSGSTGRGAQWERWLPHAVFSIVMLGCSFQLSQGASWWWAEHSLERESAALSSRIEPLLDARNRAEQARSDAQLLSQRMRAAPSQIEMLRTLHGLLPDDSKLLNWRYRGNELELLIDTQNSDPRFFVQRLQRDGHFQNVRVEPSSRGDGLQLSMTLR